MINANYIDAQSDLFDAIDGKEKKDGKITKSEMKKACGKGWLTNDFMEDTDGAHHSKLSCRRRQNMELGGESLRMCSLIAGCSRRRWSSHEGRFERIR